jgi:hypothetical protein
MHDRAFERLGALSGLAFVLLAALSGFIYPQQPRVDAAPAATLAWVHQHHAALQAGMIFDFFAAGVLLWFVGYLFVVLGRADGASSLSPIVLGSGIGVSVTTALAALPTVVLAFMDAQPGGIGDPSLVRMLGDLNTIFFAATSVMTGVFLLSLGLAMVSGAIGRTWLGWLCILVAVFNALAVWIGVTFSSYHGKGWLVIGWGAYVGFLVLMVLISVSLLRHREAAAVRSPSVALS